MIKIICKRKIEPAYFEEIFKLYRDTVAPHSRREPGNISYELYQDIDDPYTLILIEEWESEACETYHQQTSHYKKLAEAMKLYKIRSAEIHFLREVAHGDPSAK
ncbi:MAG: putative quinol monooxygenase [Bacillota bacterium]|nr:putative quinol monooxygenase [Bacillota bacterium]